MTQRQIALQIAAFKGCSMVVSLYEAGDPQVQIGIVEVRLFRGESKYKGEAYIWNLWVSEGHRRNTALSVTSFIRYKTSWRGMRICKSTPTTTTFSTQ